jgi:hypothetical protein
MEAGRGCPPPFARQERWLGKACTSRIGLIPEYRDPITQAVEMMHCPRNSENVLDFAARDDLVKPPAADEGAEGTSRANVDETVAPKRGAAPSEASRQPSVFTIVRQQHLLGLPLKSRTARADSRHATAQILRAFRHCGRPRRGALPARSTSSRPIPGFDRRPQ